MDKANSEGYPRKVRIVRSSDYRMLYKAGRKIYSESFVLFWRNGGIGHHRLGITVSRKVGNAVSRNRIKRIFREIFRRAWRTIPGQFDIILNIKPSCTKAGFTELRSEFLNAVQRIGR